MIPIALVLFFIVVLVLVREAKTQERVLMILLGALAALLTIWAVSGYSKGFDRSATPVPDGDIARSADTSASLGDTCKAHAMTVVVAGAHWCGYCRKLDRETLADPAVKAAIKDDGFVKVYEEESPEVIRALGVDGYPTTVFLDRQCKEVHRADGFRPPGPYLEEIRIARGKLPH